LETVTETRCFGGVQGTYAHTAASTGCVMRFSVFRPPQAEHEPRPVLWWLSGLTCTEENFTIKAGAQRYAAEQGVFIVAPDTSPRGLNLPGDNDAYDFGVGAGFYVDATQEPWSRHYRMETYVRDELSDVVFQHFPGRRDRQGISGHSMGGHGALTLALKHPTIYRSVSAMAPIVTPSSCPWGEKAFSGYLGPDRSAWQRYDATALVEKGYRHPTTILVDQGTKDPFLATQLQPELFAAACEKAKQPIDLRFRDGYDHSYFFVATFIGSHIEHHAKILLEGE
jgi:S-formylglutathione hydrolase